MKFSYVMGFSGIPSVCSRKDFDILVNSPAVREHIEAYRHGNAEAKKKLPAFCFHATFKGNRRLSSEAIDSGAVMVDLDNLTDEELRHYVAKALPAPEEADTTEVMLIHITPSGKGLRFVIKATSNPGYEKCSSISDYQHVFAEKIGAVPRLDAVTTDRARLSFCPCKSDILYLNERLWTDAPERTAYGEPFFDRPAATPQTATPETAGTPPETSDSGTQNTYRGISLDRIFSTYFEQHGGLPEKGVRNTRYYEAARSLRYICDFNPAVIAAHLPEVGLSHDELLSLCRSACLSTRSTHMPQDLQEIIGQLAGTDTELEDKRREKEEERKRLRNSLPPLFRCFTDLYPDSFTEAVTLAILPIAGVLATRLRAHYFVDGETQSPSFMTMVTAEQASGKSFTRRLMRVLLKDIYEEDKVNHEIEQAYREQLKLSKNTQQQPEKPKIVVRIVPPTVSIAKLLERMDQAEGQHIISFAEELDTVIKSNSAGAWSQKNDLHREGFDNAEYGQDYMSDNSYSVTLPIYYNLLFCGTPRQTSRYFSDVENGLVSRFCFATLPDQFGAEIPHYGKLTQKKLEYIETCVKKLRTAEGYHEMPFLEEPLRKWLEKNRLRALMDNDRARDTFRRRAAVIGFRAALTVSPLYAKSEAAQKKLTEFALNIADTVLKNQLEFAGTELNQIFEKESNTRPNFLLKTIFDSLAETFSLEEVARQLTRRGRKTPAKNVVYSWRRNGLIEDTPTVSTYKKTKQ